MKRKDLRDRIIPITIENIDETQKKENSESNISTTDLIYLDSYDEQYGGQKEGTRRKIFPTDYAQMNNAYTFYTIGDDRPTTCTWLRTPYDKQKIYGVSVLRKPNANSEWRKKHWNLSFITL